MVPYARMGEESGPQSPKLRRTKPLHLADAPLIGCAHGAVGHLLERGSSAQVLVNALATQVGTRRNMGGLPTYQRVRGFR